MATSVGESSSASSTPVAGDKPVLVRVKRKTYQSRLDAFWLEINERPHKRALLDLAKLSINDTSSGNVEEVNKTKKVLVRHVETVSTLEVNADYISQLFAPNSTNVEGKAKGEERISTYKADNRQEQLLSKSKQDQQALAKNARFQQIWSRRMGNKEGTNDNSLYDMCRLYDVVRIEDEERKETREQEALSMEDQAMLRSYLPLLQEFIPDAAEAIEAETHGYVEEEFVYDYYTVKDGMAVADEDVSIPFPLVQVDDDEYDEDLGDDSEYDSEDSNAEAHPRNDYPDEESEEDSEEESDATTGESEEEEKSDDIENESLDLDVEDIKRRLEVEIYDDDIYDDFDYEDGSYADDYTDGGDDEYY